MSGEYDERMEGEMGEWARQALPKEHPDKDDRPHVPAPTSQPQGELRDGGYAHLLTDEERQHIKEQSDFTDAHGNPIFHFGELLSSIGAIVGDREDAAKTALAVKMAEARLEEAHTWHDANRDPSPSGCMAIDGENKKCNGCARIRKLKQALAIAKER